MATATPSCQSEPYRRRRPEQTCLYRAVQGALETYLELAREDDWDGNAVPPHVEREFRKYLQCGILAYGFARAKCTECGDEFLIAFSCKGRALCPSCGARRMVETAAHLVDHVFPLLPVRQWVLSVPKRLRYSLKNDPRVVSVVLRIFMRIVQQELLKRCPDVPPTARFGAVSFIHRFGDALNEHIHFHCCVIDALFYLDDDTLRISELPGLSEADIVSIQTRIAQRVVRWFVRRGYLDGDDGRAMLEWQQDGGFSLDANVRIAADDRAGLERLIRYGARPPFALERLEAIDEAHLIDHLSKPQPDGVLNLRLTPLELINRIAALIPPPRVHRHRYHGVLARNSPLRAPVVALAQATSTPQPGAESEPPPAQPPPAEDEPPSTLRSPAHSTWVMLLARIFEILPLTCPHCGAEVRIIAFITEAPTVRSILECVGEPVKPPPISPARGPPSWGAIEGHSNDVDELAQPEPEYEFDQQISW